MNLQMIHVWAIPASKYFLMEKSCVSSQRVTISPVLVGPSAKFHKITRNLWKLWYFKYISYWIWSWDFQSEIENHGTLTVSWPLHLIQKGSITKGSQRHLRMLISEKAHTSVGERRGEGGEQRRACCLAWEAYHWTQQINKTRSLWQLRSGGWAQSLNREALMKPGHVMLS